MTIEKVKIYNEKKYLFLKLLIHKEIKPKTEKQRN